MGDEPEFLLLTDPNAVHQMLLRGTIARPSLAQIEHVYGVSISGMQEKIDRQARELEHVAFAPIQDSHVCKFVIA